jgi:RHH-type rel operon transcriptional repressor/antitoxin RelB
MLAIRLPAPIEKRLEKLARRTGRTKTFYAREAILRHLEDLEDVYLAERVLDRIRTGEERTIPLKDVTQRPPHPAKGTEENIGGLITPF